MHDRILILGYITKLKSLGYIYVAKGLAKCFVQVLLP